jgi:prohibitin 1
MGTIIGSILGLLATIIGSFLVGAGRRNKDDSVIFGGKAVRIVGLVALVLTLSLSSWTIVPPGHRGIQTTFGTMDMEPLDEGFSIVNPFSSVTDLSIQTRRGSDRFECESSDTQTVIVEVMYNWSPRPDLIAHLVKQHTKDYEDVLLPPAFQECVKAQISHHKVSEITQKRPEIKAAIEKNVTSWLEKYGIRVTEMSVGHIDFSPEYDKAIELKQVAEQDAEKEKNFLTQARVTAERNEAQARGEANAKIETARGQAESQILAAKAEAESLKIRGEAQAEYNKRVAESLTPNLIQKEYLDKWNGQLPIYSFGGAEASPALFLPVGK